MKQALAANLRRLRVARHLSLSDLARASGISKATLSGIEQGNANPTVETLGALAGALHAGVGELLEEPELAPIQIVRRGEPDASGQRAIDAISLAAGELDLREVLLPARHAEEVAPRAPGSRTQVLVLAGKVVTGPVGRISELSAGDYGSFPADVPIVLQTAAKPARALLLGYTPR